MPKLTSYNSGKSAQHVILFGPPKSGKTELLGKCAEQFNIILFDLDDGKDTLLKLPEEWKERITVIPIKDTIETPRGHATIDKIVRGGDFHICDNHGSVDCIQCQKLPNAEWTDIHIPTSLADGGLETIVVIDSGSQLTSSINSTCNKHLGSSLTLDWAPSRKEKDSMAEYEFQAKYLNRIFSALQVAPYHVIVTAHEIEAEREDGSIKLVPSIGTKPYAVNVAKFFGHAIYMDKVNLKHRAFSDTGFSNKVLTGSRLDVALEGMQEMSLLPIFRGEFNTGKQSRQEQAQHVLQNVTQTLASPAVPKPTFQLKK